MQDFPGDYRAGNRLDGLAEMEFIGHHRKGDKCQHSSLPRYYLLLGRTLQAFAFRRAFRKKTQYVSRNISASCGHQ